MKTYRTSEIAVLINVHPNRVRLYEKWGYIEPVVREANGYRIYTERHLEQLRLMQLASRSESVKIQYRIELIEILEVNVERGNTLIIIEHNIEVIKRADWIIDLGPEASVQGGKIIFEGTPKQLHQNSDSLTAKYI